MPGVAVWFADLTLLIGDRHKDTEKHVDCHEVPGSKADTCQLVHAINEVWPLMAFHLMIILLAHFAAHAGVPELGAKELVYLQEQESEVGEVVVMHTAFVEVVIGGVMVGITDQNTHGVNVLQLRTGPLLDVPICQQSEGTVIEVPVCPIVEFADHEPSTIELQKLGLRAPLDGYDHYLWKELSLFFVCGCLPGATTHIGTC